jgi:hypothetical protein
MRDLVNINLDDDSEDELIARFRKPKQSLPVTYRSSQESLLVPAEPLQDYFNKGRPSRNAREQATT